MERLLFFLEGETGSGPIRALYVEALRDGFDKTEDVFVLDIG